MKWKKYTFLVVFVAFQARSTNSEEITSFTEPYRDIDIAAPEMGTVDQIDVKEGDRVSAGQTLARLNDDILQVSLKMAKEGMESEGRLNSARGELRMYVDRLTKIVSLWNRNHASQQEVDRTKSQKEIAAAQVQAVEEELKIKAIEFERIQAQLSRRRVKSPIDGIVTKIYKDAGEFVSAADPIVVKVVQLDPILAVFSVPMKAAQTLNKNDQISIVVGELKEPRTGTIEFVSPTTDAQSGTTRVKIRIPNPDGRLKSGESCQLLLDGYDEALANKSDDEKFDTKSVSNRRRVVPKPRKKKP